MKKYLFIIMGVLSFFFFSDSVNALTFEVNEQNIEVTKETSIYYAYSIYPEIIDKDYIYVLYNCESGNISLFSSTKPLGFSPETFLQGIASSSQVIVSLYSNTIVSQYFFGADGTHSIKKDNESISSNQSLGFQQGYYLVYSTNDISINNTLFRANLTKQQILDYFAFIPTYKITYYINNEIYKEIEVEEGSSHTLLEYIPFENYKFSGWQYDENIDLSNITSDINIYGTTEYVRPNMNYSEDINSIIHDISISIIGKNVPVEFDYVYTIMDFILLILLVLIVLSPFVILIKLLSGRW